MEPCIACNKSVAQYHDIITVPYCSLECRVSRYTPQSLGPVFPVPDREDETPPEIGSTRDTFLRGEHTLPHVVPLSMDQLVDGSEAPLMLVYTDENMQLAIEVVAPGGVVAREIHPTQTQFIRIERGVARVDIYYAENINVLYRSFELSAAEVPDNIVNDSIVIHAGVYHKVTNLSQRDSMKFYTIYAPHVH
jgi:mannose-6-phosphate isomerase-like protein (cupin superfamily)